MINYFVKEGPLVRQKSEPDFGRDKIIWIDLIDSNFEERSQVEKVFGVELFTKQESEEIESSSKYLETAEEIGINLNFIKGKNDAYENEPVSFILRNKTLITQREHNYKTFDDTYRKVAFHKPKDGYDIFMLILEIRIDFDADLIENITDIISSISKDLVRDRDFDKELLLRITTLQETTITIRENIVEKQRVLSAMLKSKNFDPEDYETMRIMLKDVGSLLDHTSFNFERLEFLQNTFLGLVDIEQNRIIKIFTVVTVVFMPPTLIASLYGMNFHFMPELDEIWGYPFALLLMFFSSVSTLWFFKRKKWL